MHVRRKRGSLEQRQNYWGWLFISPFLVGMVLIYADVIIDSLRFSFSDIVMGNTGYTLENAGFKHYHYALFVDPSYNKTVFESFLGFFTTIPVIVIFSLFVAVMLNQKMPGRSLFRALFFVPVILATGIVAKAEIGNTVMAGYQELSGVSSGLPGASQILDPASIQRSLQSLNISTAWFDFIIATVNNIYGLVNQSGVQIILFLAGLQGISPSVYEAALIEGASGWEVFWKITFPMLSPVILVNAVYSTIDNFTNAANPIMNIISTSAFSQNDYGTASAMAWIYFLLIAVVLGVIALLGKRLVFHQEKF